MNHETGSGQIPLDGNAWEKTFNNYRFLAGYESSQQFILEVNWSEDGEKWKEVLRFEEENETN
ncbi:hypothetical protein [Oceanobacillus halotolerans]|uniref:hypothetical protein n=1 Tax=Oceanobacillus halotolerans TaxID=2663380 RepID=UPI0013D0DDED|nr:hypothetical protein [Oceanobacillus halotolerans]